MQRSPSFGRKLLNHKVWEHGSIFRGITTVREQPSLGNDLSALWGRRMSLTVWSNRAILCSCIYSSVVESIISGFHLSPGWCRALPVPIDLHEHWRDSACCSSSHPKKILANLGQTSCSLQGPVSLHPMQRKPGELI